MTCRDFVPWPDNRLRSVAQKVTEITDDIRALWSDMVETMDAMPGVGLAAPQIGEMLQLAVVDVSDARNARVFLANPEKIWVSEEMSAYEEASPNLPGVFAKVMRPKRVKVQYLDETGRLQERTFDGLEATSVQHQIDHLNGRMYFDNLKRVKRDMLLRKARKLYS